MNDSTQSYIKGQIDGRLRASGAAIQAWQHDAYLAGADNAPLSRRLIDEAHASLPGLIEPSAMPSLTEVFSTLQVQRLRLRHDQQVPEWELSPSASGAPM